MRQLYHMGCGSDDDPCRSFSIPYKYHKFTMFNITIAVYRPRSRVMSYTSNECVPGDDLREYFPFIISIENCNVHHHKIEVFQPV